MPTVEDLGRAVKAKYSGAYDDIPDADLGVKIQAKFPGAYDDYATPVPGRGMGAPPVAGGPAFSAPAQLPWYHEILNRIENVIAAPTTFLGSPSPDAEKRTHSLTGREPLLNPQVANRESKPILDATQLFSDPQGAPQSIAEGLAKGVAHTASGFTTPANVGLMTGTAGLGEALPVVSKLVATGFGLQALRDAFNRSPEFAEQVRKGDYPSAAQTLAEIGVGTAVGIAAAKHATSDVVPKTFAEQAADDVAAKNQNSPAVKTARKLAGQPEPVTEAETARDLDRINTPAPQRYPEASRDWQVKEERPQNPPSPRKTAAKPTVPVEGPSDEQQRLEAAREQLAKSITDKRYDELGEHDKLAIDSLAREGYGSAPPENAAEGTPAAPVEAAPPEAERKDVNDTVTSPRQAKPARQAEKPVAYGSDTDVRIPGENRSYPAVYSVREASDVYPSHNPFSFEPNPDYYHRNDRNYAEQRNAERVVKQEAEFDPGFMVNDNPDATNGPPIIDEHGNVLGGNSRTMTLARVRENRPEASAAYRDLVRQQSKRFGVAPELVDRMENPVLVRQMTGEFDPQQAVTDLNKTGTAALTQAERAISDSKRLSSDTADYLTRRIEEHGADGTLAQALEGNGGRDIVNRLVDDGVITAQEKPQLLNSDGSMTPEGKQRVGRLLSGQFFNSARELEETAPELRAKLDRVVPSVMRTAQREEWDISEPVKEAVSLLKDARARGVPVDDIVRQEGLFGTGGHSDDAVAIARTLEGKPTAIARAFRQYASDEELSRPGTPMTMGFEPPSRDDAFSAAFGEKSEGNSSKFPVNSQPAGAAALPLRAATQERPTPQPPAESSAVALESPAKVAGRWADTKDAFLRTVAPAARTEGARQTGYAVREMTAELARRDAVAQETFKSTRKMFAGRQQKDNWDFMARADEGRPQRDLALQQIANSMNAMLKEKVREVQELGTGKLETYYEHYFPRYWKNPKDVQSWVGSFFRRRPIEGSKSFLKQRKYPTFEDAINAGKQPVSDNPVDLFLMKLHEMNKYVLGHKMWADPKTGVEYFKATERAPMGYQRIDDPMATVYGKPTVTVEESFDMPLMEQLYDFADSIGINHERNVRLQGAPRGAQGLATREGGVQTKFGSPEQVLAHEIGHQVEFKYKISRALKGPGVAKELNDLAAMRWEGQQGPNASASYKAYARTTDEKMANAIAAMIYAPERFREVAPKTWDLLRDELHANPDLRPLLDIKKSMTLGTNDAEIPVGGLVVRGGYWAPEDRATILNNYLSPGFRGNPIYDTIATAGNSLNQVQLAGPSFHFLTTSMEAMISKDALAIRQAAEGRVVDAAMSHLEAYVAPLTSYIKGKRLQKQLLQLGTGGPQLARIADAVVKGGGRAFRDSAYETGQAQRMADAFRRGGLGGMVEGIARSPLALPDLASHWLMAKWVPRVKLGAFYDLARFELSRLPAGATLEDAQPALSRAWDSVDNRLGQMVYDNTFWNRKAKDLAMIAIRAVGWDLGSLREGLGGVHDLAFGNSEGDRLTNRSAYLAAAAVRTAIMGGAVYYLLTGQWPRRAKDHFFPGGHSMPGFAKDAVNWSTHPLDTATGKVSPIWPMTYEMLSNQDYFGHPISKTNKLSTQRVIDYLKFMGKDALPIAVRNAIEHGGITDDDMFQFFGMPKEPRALRENQ